MSGQTAPLLFPYPTGGDLVQGVDEAIKALAEAVDDQFVGTDAALAAGVNMTMGASRAYKRGRQVLVLAKPMTATAAIAAGATIATLLATYRPAVVWYGLWHNASAGTPVLISIDIDGSVHTNNAIANGNAIYGSLTLPL